MIATPAASFSLLIEEKFGIAHERQILEIEAPAPGILALRDKESGEVFPLQHSKIHPSLAYLLIGLQPFQRLHLESHSSQEKPENVVTIEAQPRSATLQNGLVALRVPLGERRFGGGDEIVPGPLEAFQVAGDKWRGSTFLDVRSLVKLRRGWIEEEGPLRAVACYRVELGDGGFYESRITLDAGQILATVEENWKAGAGDQMVWDFGGEDFPTQLLLLDSTAGYTTRNIQPHFDQRHARLWCWTQQSQLHDLRDGYALQFGEGEDAPVAGFVTIDGGSWRGNRLNHLEAWTRRWWRNDPFSRRGQPWESKADSLPAPDVIAFRGQSVAKPHFNIEGSLAEAGQRSFALVLTRLEKVCPPALRSAGDERGCSVALGHFENRPSREVYQREQSLLRRIHIQRGLFPLHEILAIDVSPEASRVEFQPNRLGYEHTITQEHLKHTRTSDLASRKQWFLDYLAARVFGFWEAGGLAFTNPVSSRSIAPSLLFFEFLVANGHLTPEEEAICRAQLLFLATLFFSDNCYPGEATMQQLGSPDGIEPTMAGMANQNFFTDVFNTYGLAAQVFPHHPNAPLWREAFGRHWERQLEYHVYPQCGVWEESHTYYQHVLNTILPTCLRRRDDGVADDFANPRFQNMVGSALLQITPCDAYCDGARHLVAFGDHFADVPTYRYLYRELAHAFASNNPELASRLAWLYREMNGTELLEIEPQPVEWKSGAVEGLGYFFRTTSTDGTQNLLALRSGSAWAHHHHDEGSIQFFAGGRALIVDVAFGHVPENSQRKFMAVGHSRWSLQGEEPFDFLWRFNRGWIEESQSESRFPSATAFDPVFMTARGVVAPAPLPEPITHRRHIVQLAPRAFLIIDESDSDAPQITRFHLPFTEFSVEQGRVQADYPAAIGAPPIRLYIAPLSGQIPVLGHIDRPHREGFENLATREVSFAVGRRSAILICAQAPEVAFAVTENELQGDGWKVHFDSATFEVS